MNPLDRIRLNVNAVRNNPRYFGAAVLTAVSPLGATAMSSIDAGASAVDPTSTTVPVNLTQPTLPIVDGVVDINKIAPTSTSTSIHPTSVAPSTSTTQSTTTTPSTTHPTTTVAETTCDEALKKFFYEEYERQVIGIANGYGIDANALWAIKVENLTPEQKTAKDWIEYTAFEKTETSVKSDSRWSSLNEEQLEDALGDCNICKPGVKPIEFHPGTTTTLAPTTTVAPTTTSTTTTTVPNEVCDDKLNRLYRVEYSKQIRESALSRGIVIDSDDDVKNLPADVKIAIEWEAFWDTVHAMKAQGITPEYLGVANTQEAYQAALLEALELCGFCKPIEPVVVTTTTTAPTTTTSTTTTTVAPTTTTTTAPATTTTVAPTTTVASTTIAAPTTTAAVRVEGKVQERTQAERDALAHTGGAGVLGFMPAGGLEIPAALAIGTGLVAVSKRKNSGSDEISADEVAAGGPDPLAPSDDRVRNLSEMTPQEVDATNIDQLVRELTVEPPAANGAQVLFNPSRAAARAKFAEAATYEDGVLVVEGHREGDTPARRVEGRNRESAMEGYGVKDALLPSSLRLNPDQTSPSRAFEGWKSWEVPGRLAERGIEL